jgi:hypothetical protein
VTYWLGLTLHELIKWIDTANEVELEDKKERDKEKQQS